MSLPESENRDPFWTVGMFCALRHGFEYSDKEISKQLRFNSVEEMRKQFDDWDLPSWLIGADAANTSRGLGESKRNRKPRARSASRPEEVPDARAAAELFSDAIDGLGRVVEDLEHLHLFYQAKRFAGTYEFVGRWVFPRKSYSEQSWKELCEEYRQDPDVESFYVDNLSSWHPLGASPYPPRDLVVLIAAYALSDRPLEPLLKVLYPEHSQEDLEEVKKLFYEAKSQGGKRDGLWRTAQQFAAVVFGQKVGKGAPTEESPKGHLLACHITAQREAGLPDEQIRQDINKRGYEISKEEFDRLARLGLRFTST